MQNVLFCGPASREHAAYEMQSVSYQSLCEVWLADEAGLTAPELLFLYESLSAKDEELLFKAKWTDSSFVINTVRERTSERVIFDMCLRVRVLSCRCREQLCSGREAIMRQTPLCPGDLEVRMHSMYSDCNDPCSILAGTFWCMSLFDSVLSHDQLSTQDKT